MKAPRSLILAGLSIAFLASTASSASAVSISPTSVDFGRVLVNTQSQPVTFTVTKGSERGAILFNPDAGSGYNPFVFSTGAQTLWPTTSTCPRNRTGFYFVDGSTPSCTVTVSFQPLTPGSVTGITLAYLGPEAQAQVTGVGLIPRKDSLCRKKHGRFVSHKPISKYCANRKG